jgi:hypothetical protein
LSEPSFLVDRGPVTNTVKKFVVDQVIGGPVNTVLFLAAMGYFRGLNGEVLLEYIREVRYNNRG